MPAHAWKTALSSHVDSLFASVSSFFLSSGARIVYIYIYVCIYTHTFIYFHLFFLTFSGHKDDLETCKQVFKFVLRLTPASKLP